jgi:hypothetical protein
MADDGPHIDSGWAVEGPTSDSHSNSAGVEHVDHTPQVVQYDGGKEVSGSRTNISGQGGWDKVHEGKDGKLW